MDGERRNKRKIEEETEESEEDKMEKFFALIRSTREVRERMMTGDGFKKSATGQEIKPSPATGPASPVVVSWNPSFQPEDFSPNYYAPSSKPSTTTSTSDDLATPPVVAGPSTNKNEDGDHGKDKKQEKVIEGGDGLDLNLSL